MTGDETREVPINGSGSTEPDTRTPEQIEADIAVQREQLAETIDALTAKIDVKARAKDQVADLRYRATTEDGRPRPEVLAGVGVVVAVVVGVLVWRHRR